MSKQVLDSLQRHQKTELLLGLLCLIRIASAQNSETSDEGHDTFRSVVMGMGVVVVIFCCIAGVLIDNCITRRRNRENNHNNALFAPPFSSSSESIAVDPSTPRTTSHLI